MRLIWKIIKFLFLEVDYDGTLTSMLHPVGVAVKTKEEAERFVKESREGFRRSYYSINIYDKYEEGNLG